MTLPVDEAHFDDDALGRVIAAVEPVAERFRSDGYRLYLVGGIVRDLWLGDHHRSEDIDLTTDARPEAIESLVGPMASGLWTQGRRFGTIGALIGGRSLEITTHRSESYDLESRKPDVIFGDDLRIDLSRRDFTINAMAVSISDRTLHDPFDGIGDLRLRVLRTPIDPAVSFTDDPLRMLRAARFVPRFGLEVHDGLAAAVEEFGSRLGIVSAERIHDELERLLHLPEPARGLEFLRTTGLLRVVIPQLAESEVEMSASAGAAGRTPLSRRAGLLAPLSPDDAREWLETTRYSSADRTATVAVLDAVGRLRQTTPSSGTVRRLVDAVGLESVEAVFDTARNVAAGSVDVNALAEIFTALADEERLDDLGAPLSGRDIIDHLGVQPGPLVGEAMAYLRAHRLESGELSEREARSLLDSWYATRSG